MKQCKHTPLSEETPSECRGSGGIKAMYIMVKHSTEEQAQERLNECLETEDYETACYIRDHKKVVYKVK